MQERGWNPFCWSTGRIPTSSPCWLNYKAYRNNCHNTGADPIEVIEAIESEAIEPSPPISINSVVSCAS